MFLVKSFLFEYDVGRLYLHFFFFKQKTAYELRISDWSSDVCSSDLFARNRDGNSQSDAKAVAPGFGEDAGGHRTRRQIPGHLGPGKGAVGPLRSQQCRIVAIMFARHGEDRKSVG